MKHVISGWRRAAGILAAAMLCAGLILPQAAYAGTTGNISGTVTDASGKPVADVSVTAASAAQSAQTTTDAHGFFTLVNLTPDTYTVSFQKQGYQAVAVPGIVVFQDQTVSLKQHLSTSLKTIATVHAAGPSNLVKPNQGSDVYNVSGQQLTAATNPGDLHETVYQYASVVPGVTASGFPGQPRVRGGQVTDLGYEYDGIPIEDRIVGFFSSNLSNIGVANLEVYTGGLGAADATNGTGYLNSVAKVGTYPGFTHLFGQFTSPEANHYLTFERGGATANHRFSYYVGFDGVDSHNQYDYGEHTYPAVLFWGYDGPGTVKTRDWVGNFHYRPDPNDDIQFLVTNSLGEFNFNYLINKSAGQPPVLGFLPCPGATAGATMTGAAGGTAPNGATCPEGLYWGAQAPGGGNIWHHYGGLGKIQWNHNLNDHSFMDFRIAENFNQYIFDQPIGDANIVNLENPGGGWNWANDILGLTPMPGQTSACPLYPYAAGTPVAAPVYNSAAAGSPPVAATDLGDICAFDDGIQNFWGDRRSNMYFGNLDYTNAVNENLTIKAGASDEVDNNVFNYYVTNGFATKPNGSLAWPGIYELATYPTNRQSVYGEAQVHIGKFMLDPGLNYSQMHYGFPADQGYATGTPNCPTTCNVFSGGETERILTPTFNGTYTFDPYDVLRFSYGNTASFIASAYVYTSPLSRSYNRRNPFQQGNTYQPQINHAWDLMWEHNFKDGTTFRVGPYFNKTSNYFAQYAPLVGYDPKTGFPIFAKQDILANDQSHQTFGVEFALNHVNYAPRGISYWLSGTYDNFWGTSGDLSGAYINYPLPGNIIAQGTEVRAASNPLWNATLTVDYHDRGFHLDPLIYYQGDTFFNTGAVVYPSSGAAPYIGSNRQIASGYWKANLTAYKQLGPKQNFYLGMTVDNLFDNTHDVAPCYSGGTGCFPFYGPQSGIVNTTGHIYQNYTQNPRLFYFFAGVKM